MLYSFCVRLSRFAFSSSLWPPPNSEDIALNSKTVAAASARGRATSGAAAATVLNVSINPPPPPELDPPPPELDPLPFISPSAFPAVFARFDALPRALLTELSALRTEMIFDTVSPKAPPKALATSPKTVSVLPSDPFIFPMSVARAVTAGFAVPPHATYAACTSVTAVETLVVATLRLLCAAVV